MLFRTDLAIEATGQAEPLPKKGVVRSREQQDGLTLDKLHITSPQAAQALGKPQGHYVTLQLPALSEDERLLSRAALCLQRELTAFLPATGTVLVVGLGNRTVTPDALGPMAADMVLATRHIRGEFARTAGLEDLRPTAVLSPGVLGQTGAETGEIVRGVCRELSPVAVIAIDALAACRPERLGCTVQLCDVGIAPGSGVGNNRRPLNREMLGIPVLGVGVPTVVDAASLLEETAESSGGRLSMMVTPREIDLVIARAARLIALAINGALQPDYSPKELIGVARGL